jgi:hypothetical protein
MAEIFIKPIMKQLIFKKLANFSAFGDGRQYGALFDAIQLLRTCVGEDIIKEEYKDKYDDLGETLTYFSEQANHISHFFSLLSNRDFKQSNIYKEVYHQYLIALGKAPVVITKTVGFLHFLISKTSLTNETIPSSYLEGSSRDIIDFEDKKDPNSKYGKNKFGGNESNENSANTEPL